MERYRLVYRMRLEKKHENEDGLGPRLEYEFEDRNDSLAHRVVRNFINERPGRVFVELLNIVSTHND